MASLTTSFDELFARTPVMAILRGYSPERTVELANNAWDLGVDCIEVPIQNTEALDALTATVTAGKLRGKHVGAGTVVTLEHVRQAAEAGAAFTVSPGLKASVVRASIAAGMPTLPGVATATEIETALDLDLDWVKAFPAAELGPSWFTAMSAPFPQIKFVATGGMGAGNAREFLDGGAKVVSLGSALADPAAWPAIAALVKTPAGSLA
ncbi:MULTISPECIES: bifunctional 4-hydroxy-2-oxoglutarate aldolase/2-dehydro-3-deoxy-phosphogluconate aldolase [unclassified Cryobacterium]|uniref:bifunctional 4-hydroxy-2-oxoglutarate aldolase/2-dehydro-3-deoxy-phosphogluconate aldolase n=1 Tax=unclassified Cryobacterium TaxID=2649013 RepID=UPI002AB50253|nr:MULTISPECIES: bifunctional 4-hydroxy-2-oxoglutarate aldolase/2-dehydro-3-deoxy-phosphogluconate aldolase [unclassified Cryobacterium]MDY7529746.1 bifunctional 4-hydroxy-2-oxoglutarate aldolase/2-dehydro-3-deoxy-phosphogluconate aldolase [Cryobacterium sp. 10C2]MDY7558124.1 bifunctional 4-hydroxy-2-oxoglutarate aldolase/2-dehydro-3-deoxy-phosphogluconate aldolase [Cryobacterium sp. 10C3]MEB0202811.1 bifunctional 4-hydroxy-2-oxoglutarate aldolase/2-dehydro-3-deoxy-phosphogluconate aldolase [Cry